MVLRPVYLASFAALLGLAHASAGAQTPDAPAPLEAKPASLQKSTDALHATPEPLTQGVTPQLALQVAPPLAPSLARESSPASAAKPSAFNWRSLAPFQDPLKVADCAGLLSGPLPQPLSLTQTLERSVCLSPSLRQAQARSAQSRAALAQQDAAQDAQVSLQASQSWRQDTDSSTRQAQLRWSKPLWDSGLHDAKTDLARAQATEAELGTPAARQQAAIDAASRFYQVLSAQQASLTADRALTQANQALTSVRARREQGAAYKLEELQAQAQVAQAQHARAQARNRLEVAQSALRLSLNWPQEQPLVLAPAWKAECALPSSLSASDLWPEVREHVLQNNPSLKLSRARLEAAERQVKVADRWGRPVLQGNVAWQDTRQGPSHIAGAQAGLTLDVPLSQGYARQQQIGQALAAKEQAIAQHEQTLRDVEQQLRTVRAQLNNHEEGCAAAQDALTQQEQAQQHAQARYEAGVGTLQEWLLQQTAFAQAQERWVNAHLDAELARLELMRLGGSLIPENR